MTNPQPVVEISARKSTGIINLIKSALANPGLVYYFAWRDVRVRYKQSALGVLWVVLQPLLLSFVIYFIFVKGGKVNFGFGTGLPIFVGIMTGLVIWTFFEQTTTAISNALVSNQQIITKIYFPRLVPCIGSLLAGLVDLFFGFIVLFIIALFLHANISIDGVLKFMVVLVGFLFFAFGFGVFFAAVNARFRDIKYVIPLLMRILLFASPVFYTLNNIPARYRNIAQLSPISMTIQSARQLIFLHQAIDLKVFLATLCITAVLLVIGFVVFWRVDKNVTDII
jgi:lipopolysaccharide transport system permease protein